MRCRDAFSFHDRSCPRVNPFTAPHARTLSVLQTRGRRREHYQWNMDIFGVSTVAAEAELLAAICSFFSAVGLTAREVGIKVSSRRVLQEVCRIAGVPDDRFGAVCVIVDKVSRPVRDRVGFGCRLYEYNE